MIERNKCEIREIGIDELVLSGGVLELKSGEKGLFLARNAIDGTWIAVDNLYGICWAEEFHNRDAAIDWLRDYE